MLSMVRLRARSTTLHRFYPAVAASIVQARGDLADFAAKSGADAEQLDRIRLSSSEALTNVVQYAYEDQGGQVDDRRKDGRKGVFHSVCGSSAAAGRST